MKKLSFLFLIFITLSAFSIKDVKAPSMDKTTRSEMPRNHPPKVLSIDPDSGVINMKKATQGSVYISFLAYPTPCVTVLRRGEVVQNSERFIIETTDRSTSITIESVRAEDAGVYEVQLDNGYGSDSVIFIIKVID